MPVTIAAQRTAIEMDVPAVVFNSWRQSTSRWGGSRNALLRSGHLRYENSPSTLPISTILLGSKTHLKIKVRMLLAMAL